MNQGVQPSSAWSRAMMMSLADLDRELHEYGKTVATETQRLDNSTTTDSAQFAVRKISDTDAQALVSNAALQLFPKDSPEHASTMSHLTNLMRQFPDRPEVQRALAYGYFQKGDSENSLEHARTAMKLEDADPEMEMLSAYANNEGQTDVIRIQSAYAKLSPFMITALRMNTDYAPAHNLTGLALLADAKPDQAAKSIGRAAALRPSNSHYLLALAQAQDAVGNFDAARTLLTILKANEDPYIAERATQILAEVGRLRKQQAQWAEMGISASSYKDPTDPRWKPKPGSATAAQPAPASTQDSKPDTRKTEYLKGTLVSVDCSDDPGAVLSVRSTAGKLWKLAISDRKNFLLINPENFSCAWKDERVSVNYKVSGADTGDVVSLSVD